MLHFVNSNYLGTTEPETATIYGRQWCPTSICTCTYCDLEKVNHYLKLVENGRRIILELIYFNETVLRPYCITANVTVTKLEFYAGDLEVIENYAFDTEIFSYTQEIIFHNMHKLKYIDSQAFVGFIALNSLTFDETGIESFGARVLKPVASSLTRLAIVGNDCIIGLTNLTGLVDLPKLRVLQITGNKFNSILEVNSFTGCKNLKSLALQDNMIETIPSGIFAPLKSIVEITMNDNSLTNLPQNIFKDQLVIQDLKIDIRRNKWHCNCSLTYTKNLLRNYSIRFINSDLISCSTPSQYTNKFIIDADFCDEYGENRNNSEPTTPVSPPPEPTVCMTVLPEIFEHGELIVENNFRIYRVSRDSVQLIIIEPNHRDIIMWFPTNSMSILANNTISDLPCHNLNIVEFIISDLDPDIVYTFCIVDSNDMRLATPFNCKSFMTGRDDWEQLPPWIDDKSISIFIVVNCFMLLLSIIFGSVGIFFIIRRNPELIKSNNRLVFINDDILVMPKGYTETERNRLALNQLYSR